MGLLKKNLKIGVLGGSFDPLHWGHINSLLTVREKFLLDSIYVVPAFQSPLSRSIGEASGFHRLEMVKRAFQSYPFVRVDEQELRREGKSYSYKTVENFAEKHEKVKLFFILGMDQFKKLDQWKNVLRILEKSNLVVTSRPGCSFPEKKSQLPEVLKKLALASSFKRVVTLKNFKSIYFCPLKDMDISSSLVRERAKKGLSINHLVPSSVESYIKDKNIYRLKRQLGDIKKLAFFCRKELKAKKAFNIKLYDLSEGSLSFSLGLTASSLNPRHGKALGQHLEKKIQESFSLTPLGKEGEEEGQWIAMDYRDLGIHIFYDYNRKKYGFDKTWGAFPEIS